ncbi:MAG TPA: hypothetical protein VNI34_03285 [Candidatus Nitrosotalea sp.]|nr:hypothetical protein [Candidatus Nitrosotalea sp.]
MATAIEYDLDGSGREAQRRQLMARSDALLEEVEQLLLGDCSELPDPLADAIEALDRRLARAQRQGRARTLRAAHRLVFSVQQRLMALNPLHPQPRMHPGRAAGTPTFQAVAAGARWKFLTLPPPPATEAEVGAQAEWLDLVHQTVERAFDRWACAQHQAQQAARSGPCAQGDMARALAAASAARAAWQNYFELSEEEAGLSR